MRTTAPLGQRQGPRAWLIVAAVVALAAVQLASLLDPLLVRMNAEPRAVTARGALVAEERSTVAVFDEVSPSVVFLTTTGRIVHPRTRGVLEVPRGAGSGFVWD